MIKVIAYRMEWWAPDDWATLNPVPLRAGIDDVDPTLIVPRAVVKQPAQSAEPTEVGVPLWDEAGTVHLRDPSTGLWVSMSASGPVTTAWADLDHPVRYLPPGFVRIPPDDDMLVMLLHQLRSLLADGPTKAEALQGLRALLRRYLF